MAQQFFKFPFPLSVLVSYYALNSSPSPSPLLFLISLFLKPHEIKVMYDFQKIPPKRKLFFFV